MFNIGKRNRKFRKEEEQVTHTVSVVVVIVFIFRKVVALLVLILLPVSEKYKSLFFIFLLLGFNWTTKKTNLMNVEDNWSVKAIRRKTTGTGRMKYMRHLPRRFKSNFREGTVAAPRTKGVASAS
ncbi:hypothetical protein IFM89_012875 [Coptis chinensis]|uniref:60S ribosomal protein L37 n=1 Tax=Coptis chinensis TaxID=261450 RepID=A0A835HCC9_9MAGN|nr:hypothetical protein IFM89_012875 [Coptis chinensis]